MGTWNTKPFGNDTASDWLWELEKSSDDSVLKAALGEDTDGDEIVAAAAVIEAARREPIGKLPPKAKAWVSERGFVPSDALVAQAIAVVEKIKTESELRELWEESGSLKSWLKQMDSLMVGLREGLSKPPPVRLPKASGTPRKLDKLIEKINPAEESPLRKMLRKKLEAITDLEAPLTGIILASSPLTLLAKQGLLPEAKRLVERGAKINPERRGQINFNPLGQACVVGRTEMVKWLLERGAKINPNTIYYAIKSGNIATIEVLVQHGVQLDTEKWGSEFKQGYSTYDTLLHKAVDANHPHVIEFLVGNGLNLESKNSLGMTPLSWAANAHPESTRKTVVEKLLLLGANPNTKDKHGFTPLDCAAYHKSNEAVCELLKNYGGRLGKEIPE